MKTEKPDARFRKKTYRSAPAEFDKTQAQAWADGYNQAISDYNERWNDARAEWWGE